MAPPKYRATCNKCGTPQLAWAQDPAGAWHLVERLKSGRSARHVCAPGSTTLWAEYEQMAVPPQYPEGTIDDCFKD